MSAFMVDDRTINEIVSCLAFDRDARSIHGKLASLGIANLDGAQIQECKNLGMAMFAMNACAIVARYGEGEPEKFRALDYRFDFVFGVSECHVLKRLSCFLYQCTEGKVDETPLYQILEEYSNSLAHHIVSNLPEYEAAPWG